MIIIPATQLSADVTKTTIIGNRMMVLIIVFCQCELFSSRAVEKNCLTTKNCIANEK